MRYFDANDIYIDFIRFIMNIEKWFQNLIFWNEIQIKLDKNSNWNFIESIWNEFDSNWIENEFDFNWIENELEFELNRKWIWIRIK